MLDMFDFGALIIIIIILIILGPRIIKAIKKNIFDGTKERVLPLTQLKDKLEFGLIAGSDKAVIRFGTGGKGPFVEFRKHVKKGEPNRFQMILKEDVCNHNIFERCRVALNNKGIPFKVEESNDKNSECFVVECGRNSELAFVCGNAVLTKGFGIPPDGYCLYRELGHFTLQGLGFGQYGECLEYGINIDIEEMPSITKCLKNSPDENAFVIFGCKCRQLPMLKREIDNDGKMLFILEFPVSSRREKEVIRKLDAEGIKLDKFDLTTLARFYKTPDNLLSINGYVDNRQSWHYRPTYRIPLGADTKTVAENVKKLILDSGLCFVQRFGAPTLIRYRLSEFVTADWKPKEGYDSNADESNSGNSAHRDQAFDNPDDHEPTA